MLDTIIKEFSARVKENPIFILKIFIAKITNTEIKNVNLHNISLTMQELLVFQKYTEEFLKGKPVSKIINESSFYGYDFFVNDDVLDPRMDTEVLVDSVLKDLDSLKKYNILDICTGSGVILLSLLKHLPNSNGIGIDISEKALEVANINKEKLKLSSQAEFMKSDFLKEVLNEKYFNYFDVIVSNPPYIKTEDLKTLDKSVTNYDPIIALDGGKDGTEAYDKILSTVSPILKPNGVIYFEIGYDIKDDVIDIARSYGFTVEKAIEDLAGIDRVLKINKKTLKN